MKKQLNWKEIWAKFDHWYSHQSHNSVLTMEWISQKKKIQKLVDTAINLEGK